MAWCYYCRTHTVNGRCPHCNRMYQEPNKSYDYYGREIKKTSTNSSSKPSSSSSCRSSGSYSNYSYSNNDSFAAGFWLSLVISFFSIIIAVKKDKSEMKRGALVGTIVWGLVIIHVITILVATYISSTYPPS